MIINNEEYGAPWNDQFYNVTFYFIIELENIKFKSELLELSFCLSGPYNYEYSELKNHTLEQIHETYKIDYDDIMIVDINKK